LIDVLNHTLIEAAERRKTRANRRP